MNVCIQIFLETQRVNSRHAVTLNSAIVSYRMW